MTLRFLTDQKAVEYLRRVETFPRHGRNHWVGAHCQAPNQIRLPALFGNLGEDRLADQRHRFSAERRQTAVDVDVAFLAGGQHEVAVVHGVAFQ